MILDCLAREGSSVFGFPGFPDKEILDENRKLSYNQSLFGSRSSIYAQVRSTLKQNLTMLSTCTRSSTQLSSP